MDTLASWLYRFILRGVKTAISIPDQTLQQVNRRARELGLNRSQFFARAVERYLRELDDDDITERINAALDAAPGDDSNAVAAAHGRRFLLAATADDEW